LYWVKIGQGLRQKLSNKSKKITSIDDCVTFLVDAANEKNAFDINVYHVAGSWALTDYVLVMSVKNEIHCRAVSLDLDQVIRESVSRQAIDFFVPPKVTGKPESGWIIIDLNSILIHIMLVDQRGYYGLDSLLEKKADTVQHA